MSASDLLNLWGLKDNARYSASVRQDRRSKNALPRMQPRCSVSELKTELCVV